jgi:ribosomal RNA-processing protein 36
VMNYKNSTVDQAKSFKRANKNRPQELTSKKPVPIYRNIFQTKKHESIDPRFSSAFGDYNPNVFRKTYGFLQEMRLKEKEVIDYSYLDFA